MATHARQSLLSLHGTARRRDAPGARRVAARFEHLAFQRMQRWALGCKARAKSVNPKSRIEVAHGDGLRDDSRQVLRLEHRSLRVATPRAFERRQRLGVHLFQQSHERRRWLGRRVARSTVARPSLRR